MRGVGRDVREAAEWGVRRRVEHLDHGAVGQAAEVQDHVGALGQAPSTTLDPCCGPFTGFGMVPSPGSGVAIAGFHLHHRPAAGSVPRRSGRTAARPPVRLGSSLPLLSVTQTDGRLQVFDADRQHRARFRNRELQPFNNRKRYKDGSTSKTGQVTPLTTITLQKNSGFQMGRDVGMGTPRQFPPRTGCAAARESAPRSAPGCPGTTATVGLEIAVLNHDRDLTEGYVGPSSRDVESRSVNGAPEPARAACRTPVLSLADVLDRPGSARSLLARRRHSSRHAQRVVVVPEGGGALILGVQVVWRSRN